MGKTKLSKKARREEKKKIESQRKRSKIIAMSIISIVIWSGYFFLINTSTTFVPFSDENTESYSGVVTDVYIKKTTGYKNRDVTWVYLELDNVQHFRVNIKMLLEKDISFESFKKNVLNNTVEIKYAHSKAEKLVSIQTEEKSIITYDDMNKTNQSNRIGISLVCFFVISFIGCYLFL